ncbi:MAG: hypothetical protein V4707_12600 [Pseudomonadota bacterium]
MRAWLFAGCAMALAVSPMTAWAQQADDDWDFAQDAATGRTVALARYEAGQMIVAECQAGVLRAALVGLPATTGTHYTVEARRADGRTDTQVWSAAPGQTTFLTPTAARDSRFLRGGGMFEIHAAVGAPPVQATFDLPAQSANLDRVLTACGAPLQDDRDAMPVVRDLLFEANRSPLPNAAMASPRPLIEVSCVVRTRELRECRPTRVRPGFEDKDREAAEAMNERGVRISGPRGPVPQGVVYTAVAAPTE